METKKLNKITALWIVAILVLFILSIILGIIMRLNQGELIKIQPPTFYADMTTHGVTMIGIWFVAGMAAVNYFMERYVKTSYTANMFAMVMTVIGVVMLWLSTLVGNFHAGWTFLYPLPFKIMWSTWATPLFLWSIGVFGIGWFVWTISLMAAMLKKYSMSQVLAWQHFGKKDPEVSTPPFVLISMISLIGVLTCLIAAVILLILLFAEYYSGGTFKNDALLIKNLTYFFGHTIANEMLYLGLAVIYELFPEVSGRPKLKTTWYVALAWNLTLFFVLAAFFHHLYMDFVQPEGLQIIGQLASYLASLPSSGVTVFSIIVVVFRNKINWSLTNSLFFIGIVGWVVGGVGAVIDATISNNFILHNTLWVPAHFHTYNAMGNVLFSLGFFHWFSKYATNHSLPDKYSFVKLAILIIGGVGFLLAFYIAGADSVPRRYSTYPKGLESAKTLAAVGGVFAIVYLTGILSFFVNISKRCLNVLFQRS
ncbi:MAG: cbb3-type cytochrome c oxidase subunit I [Bacteroidia bacterium]|nr:cbb3-type cytochrome c oxidase subunit I [Bacteroidia bacterium]MCZ2248228.1 cbb3-type cytochrome c oxidase subunit I [Bacteroidia bacterium]